MQKEKPKVKTIVKETNDSFGELVINKSCAPFVIGDAISHYTHLPHDIIHCSMEKYGLPDYDFYDFYTFDMCVYTEEDNPEIIRCVFCDEKCVWQGSNIIGMLIKDFIRKFSLHPILEEGEETYVLNRDGHNTQRIFEFKENVGLMIWTWRKRIVTVCVSNDLDS